MFLLTKTAFFNDVTMTSSLRKLTVVQILRMSGWFVPKIVKIGLNLSKLRPKYRSLFSGHRVVDFIKVVKNLLQKNTTTISGNFRRDPKFGDYLFKENFIRGFCVKTGNRTKNRPPSPFPELVLFGDHFWRAENFRLKWLNNGDV